MKKKTNSFILINYFSLCVFIFLTNIINVNGNLVCLNENWIMLNNKCYLISENVTSWHRAFIDCQTYNQYNDDDGNNGNKTIKISSNLMYLTDRKDYNALIDLRSRCDDDLWIGLSTHNVPLNWTWINKIYFNVKHPWLVKL